MTARIEYRAVWPNGDPALEAKTNREEFFKQFDKLVLELTNDGLPKAYRPVVKARIVEVVEHEWQNWDEAERDLKNYDEKAVRVTSGPKHVNPPDLGVNPPVVKDWEAQNTTPPNLPWPKPDQIERVRSNRLGVWDPCVICGQVFNHCPHTRFETEAFVGMVKGMI